MEDLSMHILDIAENSINAGAGSIGITMAEDSDSDTLVLEITDNGSGMDEELLKTVTSPFATTRTTRNVGLGLPYLAQSTEAANGELKVESEFGKGTRVHATFQLSHIDCIPLGNIGDTIMALIIGHPDIDFYITCRRNGAEFIVDSRAIREELDGVPFSHPEIIGALRLMIDAGLRDLGSAAAAPVADDRGVSKGMAKR